MTEKRFIGRYAGRTIKKLIGIEDIETNRVCVTIEENIRLLNELSDENEQLKQFKENVIKWVDSQMKFNAKKYIETEDYNFKSENIDLHNFKVFIGIDSND